MRNEKSEYIKQKEQLKNIMNILFHGRRGWGMRLGEKNG